MSTFDSYPNSFAGRDFGLSISSTLNLNPSLPDSGLAFIRSFLGDTVYELSLLLTFFGLNMVRGLPVGV